MPKVIDYWEEFHNQYPNLEPFRAFIAEDPILSKIFNIVAVPNILFSAIGDYPFEDKIKEAQYISSEDIERLNNFYIETGEDPKREKEAHWLEYILSLYELVGTTSRLYRMLKKDATLSQNEIIDFINTHFRYHLAIDKTCIIEETEGVQTIKRIVGRIHPFQRLIFINNNMLQIHFLLEPIKNEIGKIKNKLDVKSVVNFQRYRPIGPVFDEICFMGDRRSNKYHVEFYFKDKKLDEFLYPIHKRYEKLVDKGEKDLTEIDQKKDMQIAPYEFVYESLSNWSLSYDSSEGVRPAGYFKRCFDCLKSEYKKVGTTTSLPFCDKDCKTQKDHEEKLPCEYETAEGYCKDPNKKRNRKSIYDFERSSPGLDENLKYENGNEISRHDQFDAGQKKFIPHEQLTLKQTKIILDELCKDEMDKKIINLLKDEVGRFKSSDKINSSAIAEELGTYPKDISRRYEQILNRAKKHPTFSDFFKK
jgi:hypothetical protein